MRYLLATGALAVLLAGSGAFALAQPTAGTSQVVVISGTASPDIYQWTNGTVRVISGSHPTHHRHMARFANRLLNRTARLAKTLTSSALRFLGTPYVFGGTSVYGFDCSGYTQHVFAMLGVRIPRTADAQYYAGMYPAGGIRTGDLVFFQTYEPGPSHVGIYLGGGHFVHASSSHGVMVSSLFDSYWAARYLGAKRVLGVY